MKQFSLKKKFLVAIAAAALACGVAAAAPTAQVVAGQTTVELDAGFLGALESLGVTPAPVAPGSLVGVDLTFPIPGGIADLGSLAGDIFHTGGLTLTAGETEVGLYNFIISTTGAPVLTGIVTVNGSVVDRLPLFDLDVDPSQVTVMANTVTIPNVGVTLTDAAAMTLSDVFMANVPAAFVGNATVVAQAAPGNDDGGDDSGDDESSDDNDDDDDDESGENNGRRWRNFFRR